MIATPTSGELPLATRHGGHRTLRTTRSISALVVGAIVATPIFLHVGDGISLGQTQKEWLRDPGVTVSFAFVALPIIVATLVLGGVIPVRGKLSNLDVGVLSLAAVACVATTFGVLTEGPGSDRFALIYLYQTIAPMAAYVAARGLARGEHPGHVFSLVFELWILIIGAVCLVLVAKTITEGVDPHHGYVDNLGPFHISKAKRFFPTVVSVCVSMAMARVLFGSRPGLRHGVAVCAMFALLLLAHSRTALAAAVCAAFVQLVIASFSRTALFNLRALAFGALSVAGVCVFAVSVGGIERDGLKAFNRLSNAAAVDDDVDASRRAKAIESVFDGLSEPLGRMYRPSIDADAFGSEDTPVDRIAHTENQIGEYGVRAGPAAVLAFLTVLAASTLQAVSRARRSMALPDSDTWMRVGLATVAVFHGIAANALQLSMTESYTAPVMWFVVGSCCRWTSSTEPRSL